MAITEGWSRLRLCVGAMQQQPARKTKRAAFSGRHVQAFYAASDKCQPAKGRPVRARAADVKISNLRKIPVQWKTQIAMLN
jgi:hypothetical protein